MKKGKEVKTEDLDKIIRQFIGYEYDTNEKRNVTILDLSGIPFEVLNITISLVSRLIFDFAFYWKKHYRTEEKKEIEVPFLLVFFAYYCKNSPN